MGSSGALSYSPGMTQVARMPGAPIAPWTRPMGLA